MILELIAFNSCSDNLHQMEPLILQKLLLEKIPLAGVMDIKVLQSNDNFVELQCSLALNHNHLGTAFGGSLSTLMILAAYSRLFIMIGGHGHVVLKSCSMEFLKPVTETLRAAAILPDKIASAIFLKAYEKKNRAKITLSSEIRLNDGSVACRMTGIFVGYQT